MNGLKYRVGFDLGSTTVKAVVVDEHTVGVNWLYSDAVGGVKVAVRPEDEQRALQFLEERARAADDRSVRQAPGGARVAGLVALVTIAVGIPALLVAIPLFANRRRIRNGDE